MAKHTRVIPAILTDDPPVLAAMVRQAEAFTDYVQIDFMDGKFVPSHSVAGEDVVAAAPKLNWEAHLMVLHPEYYFALMRQAGAKKVIFHYEAVSNPAEIVARAKESGLAVGLAINPETELARILPLTDKLDSVLFLAVHPGFYGAPFIPGVLDKIRELRRVCPGLKTGIDGGVKETNIVDVARTGVDGICVGSAIFMQKDPGASYRRLQSLVTEVVI